MPAGNQQPYVTTLGCSTGLSIGCYVEAPDGWYYDGNYTLYSYYISGYYVTAVDTEPCSTPPPPSPTPAPVTWTSIELGFSTISGPAACTRFNTSRTNIYYIDSSVFSNASAISSTSDGTGTPTNGYYSDGSIYRQSTSSALGASSNCTE